MEHRIKVCLKQKTDYYGWLNSGLWVWSWNQSPIITMKVHKFISSKKVSSCSFKLRIFKQHSSYFLTFFCQVHRDFVPKSRTVNQVFYEQVLERFRERIRRKRAETLKPKSWISHHDNTPARLYENCWQPIIYHLYPTWHPLTFFCFQD